MRPFAPITGQSPLPCLALLAVLSAPCVADEPRERPASDRANRLAYLDEFLDPYHVGRAAPRLATPQWIGEPGVEAVVVLAIDDMRDSARYEDFLRPILDRLKRIDGRAGLSIMTNRAEPADPRLAAWLKEGLSIEIHTYDHPCPCLQGGRLSAARETFDKCVDLMAGIPGNRPVAFRMPCCDSLNTPSPRFWAEIMHGVTPGGNYLSIDSSVFQVFTSADPDLPRDLVLLPDGGERFRRYIPFPSFVNTIENYPYPYPIGNRTWQFPCMVPSDWEAQHVQRPNNPDTVRDMKLAIDATVIKQGVFNLVFHPHNWMRNDQVVELIDHAVERHGTKVKFLSFREAHERINQFLLGGEPLRDARGADNGVRLLDLNDDGRLDVVIGNANRRETRIWNAGERRWDTSAFPTRIVESSDDGTRSAPAVRFGVVDGDTVLAIARTDRTSGAWSWSDAGWRKVDTWRTGWAGGPVDVFTARNGLDQGARMRDLDQDGTCELLVANDRGAAVLRWNGTTWGPWFAFPEHARFVDGDGRDAGLRLCDIDGDGRVDLVHSNETRYGLHLMTAGDGGRLDGWTRAIHDSPRAQGDAIPMIVREGTNNGAWFHSGHLWIQNEDTHRLPDHVDRRSYADLMGQTAGFPPARTPDQSLRSMRVAPSLRVELLASEPLIADPIAFDWGPDGRLWVLEMGDYPLGVGPGKSTGGRVRILDDTDADGRYDRATLFLDGLAFPTGLKAWRGGLLVLCAPDLFFAEDKDGDGRCDARDTLYTGFVEGNQQHRANGLRWGMDGWLYIANGDSGGAIESKRTGKRVPIGGRDVRIRPDDGSIDAESGQTQYGRNRDDWDNWFGGNNSNPIWQYVLPDHAARRNPHWPASDSRHQVSQPPGAAPVFPTSTTLARFNDFNMANRFTSACSPDIYRDRLLGEEFAGNAFVCEPVHNLVHREILTRSGVTFRGARSPAEQQSEFLTSDDNWFRPVMVRTGPDGGIWIADMYRLIIEHPEWIPMTWQKRFDLRSGSDQGRLYRVLPAGVPARPIPRLVDMETPALVAHLESDNGWVRDMAQQILTWKADPAAVPALETLVRQSAQPIARAQALATLGSIGRLESTHLLDAFGDSHPAVRRFAVRLAAERLSTDEGLVSAIESLGLREDDAAVRIEVILALGNAPRAKRLGEIAVRSVNDAYAGAAFASSLRIETIDAVASALTAEAPDGTFVPSEGLVAPVIRFAAATGNAKVFVQVLRAVAFAEADKAETRAIKVRLLTAAIEQIRPELRSAFEDSDRALLRSAIDGAMAVVGDPNTHAETRRAAVTLLGRAALRGESTLEQLERFLSPTQPSEVQSAAVEGLTRVGNEGAVKILLAGWRSHTPSLRAQVLDALLSREPWTNELLDRITDGTIPASQLDAARRWQLLAHRSEAIRGRAAALIHDRIASDRRAVLDQLASVRDLAPDPARGRDRFAKHCSVCHQLEGVGNHVGPDLTALSDRSIESLLVAVLDPNRAVEDKYLEFTAVLADGRQVRGMLANESSNSLTLVGQEGKQMDILRSELDSIVATGKSLMPDGLEKDLSAQDLADTLAYVRSIEGTPKTFSGNEPKVAHVRDDGSIRLLATDCRVYGPSIVFEDLYRNLGYWGSPEDRAVWEIDVPKAGRYTVHLDYACHNDTAGNRYRITVGDQAVSGSVTGTGTWDDYRSRKAGEIELPAGPNRLEFRSDGPLNGMLIDLRGIVLYP